MTYYSWRSPFAAALIVCCAAIVRPAPALAQGYSLFRPVPREAMRDLRTDRPDRTESPFTVDPGHLQIELDLVTHARDHGREGSLRFRDETIGILPVNIKVGLTPSVDIQFILDGFTVSRHVPLPAGGSTVDHGFADMLMTRVKVNLWGNDAGRTAFALLPHASLVDAGDGGRRLDAGLILPLGIDAGRGWSVGLMAEADLTEQGDGSGRQAVLVGSATVGHSLGSGFGGYLEIYGARATGDGTWSATFDLGTTRAIGRDVQLDGGVNIGLTTAADGVAMFLGLTVRR